MDIARIQILVLDDLVDAADTTVELLSMWGYDAVACYTGQPPSNPPVPIGLTWYSLISQCPGWMDLRSPGCSTNCPIADQSRSSP